jgi:serine/threonine-protein kinase RIO1
MAQRGIVHGDLSEYNVLVGPDGPVIIDLPQAVSAAGNNNARAMLLRDVANVTATLGRFAPELLDTRFGEEMCARRAGSWSRATRRFATTSRSRPTSSMPRWNG